MSERPEVVVGAGQAGLAVSRELKQAGIEHVVLEKGRVGQAWRERWDSFCLVTPNWSLQLPGHAYDGRDPDGFMPRDQVVAYLERYASGFEAPVPLTKPLILQGFFVARASGDAMNPRP